MNGDFNLARISFPIKCMSPQTFLQVQHQMTSTMPAYFYKANESSDPIERMKLVMAQSVSWYAYEHVFAKPLNPILGETYQSYAADGSKCYYEQTSHHPPRSHYLIEGPENKWKLNGYVDVEIYGGVTYASAKSNGYKRIEFEDGSTIKWNHTDDLFYGMFIGAIIH